MLALLEIIVATLNLIAVNTMKRKESVPLVNQLLKKAKGKPA